MSVAFAVMTVELANQGLNSRQRKLYLDSKHLRYCEDSMSDDPDMTIREHVVKYLNRHDPETVLREWLVWNDIAYDGPDYQMDTPEGDKQVNDLMVFLGEQARYQVSVIARTHPEVYHGTVRATMNSFISKTPLFGQ